jgi:hypothetical protein
MKRCVLALSFNPTGDRQYVQDVKLLEAVKEDGKQWANIVRTHLHGRTGLAAKNRYVSLV